MREAQALNTFFDLAQEYQDLSYLYHLPVQILRVFFGMRAALFAREDSGIFTVQFSDAHGVAAAPPARDVAAGPVQAGSWWFFPVKGRTHPHATGSDTRSRQTDPAPDEPDLLAMLAICPDQPLADHEFLFYEKFANRLGFSLHNRLLALKNLEHIHFVRTLVHDIGHNVIVPNMHFKLLLRNMTGKIAELRRLCETLAPPDATDITAINALCADIDRRHQEIGTHFQQSGFFLETLLRQSHFDQGQYVLQRTRVNLVARVAAPQVERYRQRLQDRLIAVEEVYTPDVASLLADVDVGLISQVLANFLSNAVKYTRETPGNPERRVRCSVIAKPGLFGPGKDGARVEVLSTGPAIPPEEIGGLFRENFRASNTDGEEGSGHGLYFSRLIISQHGGDCGYYRAADGNVFYITLPVRVPKTGPHQAEGSPA
jgi:Osmosensitive K+ channel histidine kinase